MPIQRAKPRLVDLDQTPLTSVSTSNMPSGTILQVQHVQLDSPETISGYSANTSTAINSTAINITPAATNSKILLEAQVTFECANYPWAQIWFFYRDSTKLGHATTGNRLVGVGIPTVSHHGDYGGNTSDQVTLRYFDSPSTTSQITYKIGFHMASQTNALYLNRNTGDANSVDYTRGVTTFVATEIKG
tara:strand:- start:53 stop:619 length:567 start_codon:yes stop_codon:yes gene_type:complete